MESPGRVHIFDITQKKFSPFLFVGIAIFHNNPYAYDTLGQKTYLRPLSTEGEGFPVPGPETL